MDKIRSFLAIDFEGFFERDLQSIMKVLEKHAWDVKWTKPASVHITLHFFGSIDPGTISSIASVVELQTRAHAPFQLGLKGVGAFPNCHRARVIWAGMDGDIAAMKTLKKNIDRALQKIGIPEEDRPFKAHLTLGRFRRPPEDLDRALGSFLEFSSVKMFRVARLVLFRSDLTREGPHYSPLHTFPLGAISNVPG